jgi:hypothetical protein
MFIRSTARKLVVALLVPTGLMLAVTFTPTDSTVTQTQVSPPLHASQNVLADDGGLGG